MSTMSMVTMSSAKAMDLSTGSVSASLTSSTHHHHQLQERRGNVSSSSVKLELVRQQQQEQQQRRTSKWSAGELDTRVRGGWGANSAVDPRNDSGNFAWKKNWQYFGQCPRSEISDIASIATSVLSTRRSKSCGSLRRLCINASRDNILVEVDGEPGDGVGRRDVLTGVAALAATISSTSNDSALAAAIAPKGFSAVLDNADGYAFYYPFGWQEVAVRGQDVAFKDVIEPLESVSVSIVKTDKTSLAELGSPDEVAKALVEKVLSSPTQKTTLKEAKERVTNGRTYYQFEFTAEARNFTRHALGTVAVSGGKFFTLTTGANERRWGKIEDKLRQVVESFTTL